MDKRNKIAQLKTMLPQIEKFYQTQKISYNQRQLIIQLAQRIEPGQPAEEIVQCVTGLKICNLGDLSRSKAYEVIQTLREQLEWMV